MLEFRTQGQGYSVKYSPFFDSRIAVATSANFGLVGNGRLYILALTPNGIVAEKHFDTQDSLFDLTFSEAHESQILTASGDGSLKLFDTALPDDAPPFPIATWHEHAREVFSCAWNLLQKDTFLSSSWDGCVKIYRPEHSQSILTLPTHSCTYSAQWSPHSAGVLSAVSSDSHLRLFDLRTPASASNHLTMKIPVHAAPSALPGQQQPPPQGVAPNEVLTHDWNKYRDSIIATAGVDRVIRVFDIRMPGKGPLAQLVGHDYAVRRIAWSPHLSDVLLSASYDMTARVWSDGSAVGVQQGAGGGGVGLGDANAGGELGRMGRHTEFVTGVDWCLFGAEGWCATCGWDERVLVWDVRGTMK